MTGPNYIGGPVWQYRKARATIMAGEREFKGKRFFELREWLEGQPMTATGKGVTLPDNKAVKSLYAALGEYLDSLQ